MTSKSTTPRKAGGRRSSSGSASTQFKKGRRPHNKSPAEEITSAPELARKVGWERCEVIKDGVPVAMTRTERQFRLVVEAAASGKVQDIAHVIELMVKYPKIVRPAKTVVQMFINGDLANV